MNKFIKNINFNNFLVLLLVLIAGFLAFKNYTPNTFLSGWDTLHPEFDLVINLKRVLWGVWRGDQGLGVVAVHSHMVELPRILILMISSIVLPMSFLRYLYVFAGLILGPLGIYFLVGEIFKGKDNKNLSLVGFLSGLYYLLNLSTLQQFYVPFEMFITQYATIPWIFYLIGKFLKNGGKKALVLLFIVSFFASNMAYAATLFWAYLASLMLYLITFWILNPEKSKIAKRIILAIFVIFASNAYWIFPNIYSIFIQSESVSNSQINQNFSQEAFLRNKEYGGLQNILVHKSFLFSWREFDEVKNKYVDLLDEWNAHLEKKYVALILWIPAIGSIIGLGIAILRRKKSVLAFLPILLFCLFFLINENAPTGFIYSILREKSKLLEEGFRMPFTKFSILYLFAGTIFLANFLANLFNFFSHNRLKLIKILILVLFSAVVVIPMLPAFNGSLISPSVRVSIPREYFELFDWFKSQPKARIAKLPLNTMWGWSSYKWGYEGSGFLWFGIDNPVLDRDFDRWNPDNESFYKEATKAFSEKNGSSFEMVFEKYDIGYIFMDKSVMSPGSENSLLNDQAIELIELSGNWEKSFESTNLIVYKNREFPKEVELPDSYSKIDVDKTYSNFDAFFQNFGHYINDSGRFYPFDNFEDKKTFKILDGGNNYRVVLDKVALQNQKLFIPDFLQFEQNLPLFVYIKESPNGYVLEFDLATPHLFVDKEEKITDEMATSFYQNINTKAVSAKYVVIGNKTFEIPNDASESFYLGSILVSKSADLDINLYSDKERVINQFSTNLIASQASLCSNSDNIVSKEYLPNGFEFQIEKDSVCSGAEFISDKQYLSKLGFFTSGSAISYPCVRDTKLDKCINLDIPNEYLSFGEKREETYFTPFTKDNYWIAFVGQGSLDKKTNAKFEDISLSVFPLIGSTKVNIGSKFDLFSYDREIEVSKLEKIELIIPKIVVANEEFGLKRGFKSANNCDLEKDGIVEKTFNNEGVLYSASNMGVSCDYYSFSNIDQSNDYILNFEGNNKQGRGLKFYLQNLQTNRMDFESILLKSKFSNNYFIARNSNGGYGFTLNLETRSFGKSQSSNLLSKIEFSAIPANWLSNIYFESQNEKNIGISNGLSLESFEKTWYGYKVKTKGTGVLTLSQGFEKGWIATNKSWQHREINSWKNGWIISEENSKAVIFYAPQILQNAGFLILIFTIIFLFFKKI